MSGSNLLVIVSGSIAACKACEVVSQLVQRGHTVRCVATESALRFVGVSTLEGLTGAPVATDLFAAGAALDHIELTRWADAVVLCPATANSLNRLAAGLADDLLGALFLAHDRAKPWLAAPAMNPAMWAHPATQASVARLREWSVQVLPVAAGRTACGEAGDGRLLDPPAIITAIETALARPERRLRVLLTSGATAEPIDAVRVITNTSTGRTGALLAGHFARAGHAVTFVRARNAERSEAACEDVPFSTFAELDSALERLRTTEFDAVIHAAAVSDFALESVVDGETVALPGAGKLDSDSAPVLHLRPNPKLLDSLRARSRNPDVRIVAFKLTHRAAAAEVRHAVKQLFARAAPDFVVHNDLAARTDGERFPATICDREGAATACATRTELALALERLLVSACASLTI
ncbi:MAG: bifunctional phosphopantothenoylcysteine decarboxylase/phosphopantothenate--cysteine ligase CoaBC [Verrucomicrobia bacterium]|nr:bifunctional phosphopantothenoylcysteine decarboxylase/phosphopantothenate--cysteine ligase CoaBC [Verrucomicrobiota bacterium]